jgi:deazaflavin-dependent oxidoreductase (nitroreductase family)
MRFVARIMFVIESVMACGKLQNLADQQVLHLTTIGRRSGLPREIEIWFVVCRERFYLFSEHREAAGWVRNLRKNSAVSVRIGKHRIDAVARVLGRDRDRALWDEVAAIADHKYGWGDGLPVEIAPRRAVT